MTCKICKLRNLDGKLGEHTVFIGARKNNDEGSWSWVDGSSWDYTNWGVNQPDGPAYNGGCIEIGKFLYSILVYLNGLKNNPFYFIYKFNDNNNKNI